MKLGVWRWAFLVAVLFLLGCGWWLAAAASWKQTRLARLTAAAELSQSGLQYVDRGEGLPVLVIHGAPGGYDQGLALAEGLGLTEGFRIIAVSRRGFLGTPLGSRFLPWQQADDLVRLLEERGVERAAVLGFSTGASVALHLAARHPEKVAALAIASGAIGPLPPREPKDPPALPLRILLDLRGDVGAAVYNRWLESSFPQAVRLALPLIYAGSPADTKNLAEFLTSEPAAAEAFRQMAETVLPISPRESGTHQDLLLLNMPTPPPHPPAAIPTLFLHGTEDAWIPIDRVREFAGKSQGARLVPVEKGSHLWWIGADGRRAAQILRNFLQNPPTASPSLLSP